MAWKTETVAAHLAIDPELADRVIGIVRGTIDPFSLPKMAEWRKQCYHDPDPRSADTRMRAIAEVLNAFDVEAINGTKHHDRYWRDCCAVYVNTGDTYNATIVYDVVRGKYLLTTMGDFVERYDRKYGIQ